MWVRINFCLIGEKLKKIMDDIFVDYVIGIQHFKYLQELLTKYSKTTTLGDALVDTENNLKDIKHKIIKRYETD